MKRKMSVLLALMLLLCSLFAVPVQAETVLKDGLEVTLTTDKESYDALETIYVKLTVKNTNSYDVENVTARIVAPAGCKLDGGNEINLGTLSAGEMQQIQVDVLEANVEAPILPQTGDDSHGTLWSVLFVVAAAVLCALVIRNPQTKRVISILLCVAIVAPYVLQAVPVQAEEHLAEIIVEKTVSVDGNPVVLTGVVSYEKPGMMLMSLRPFEIVTQPVSQTVSEGSRATFFIEVTGSDIQYQWYYKKPGSSTWTKSSNTTDTYSFTMKESYDGRSIRCKVKDANGETLTSDTVKLALPVVKITTQPKSQTVSAGSTAKFTVKATGDGLKYQWYYKKSGSSTWTKSSNTKATYSLTMKESYDGRSIRCKVTDQYGNTVTSNTVKLTLPVVKITTQPKAQTVDAGSTAKFTVAATGDGLKYQWYYKKSGSSTWSKSSQTKATYSFTMKESYDGRSIRCKVTDQYGNTATSNTVKLALPAVKITEQPTDQAALVGEKATFTVKAAGYGLTYQWYYKNAGASKWSKSSTGTTATYSFTMKESYDGRSIRCKVTDKNDNTVTSEAATLTVRSAAIMESAHPYEANTNKTWQYTHPTSAEALKVTFSADTQFESGYDYLTITDSRGESTKYTGTQLAGETIILPGSQFSAKLESDGSVQYYGFRITSVTATEWEEPEVPTPVPELDMSNAKLNKSTYAPGETITISGVRVRNADTVRFSGNNGSIATKDVQVTNSSKYTTLSDVTFTLPSNAAEGSFYIDIEARSGWVSSLYDTAFTYTVAKSDPSTKPTAPTGVSAMAYGSSIIGISWNQVSGATGYHILRSTSSSSGYTVVKTITSGSTVNWMDNVELSANTTYYYKVRAYNGSVNGTESSYVSAKTFPAAPTGVKATALSSSSIQISWNQVSGATEYNVMRSTSSSSGYTTIGRVTSGSTTTFTDTGLSANTTYYYEVKSYSSIGGGEVSSYVSAKTDAASTPSTPTSDYTYTVSSGKATITGYTGNDTNLVIPSTVGGYPVTQIGAGAFEENETIITVEIPSGVTAIGEAAFADCEKLTTVQLPDTVKEIGDSAFDLCKKLGNIDLPANLETIGKFAFMECLGLTSIVIPDKVTSIGNQAFCWCENLASVIIPSSVEVIGKNVFDECASNLVIYGEAGSEAEDYANDNDITFKEIGSSTIKLPELDVSNAKLNKSTYAPGETITISGIKVKNADYVHFSGNNAYISTKDVDVTNSSSYVSVGNVTLTIPSSSATGSFYISVTACDDEGNASAINMTLTYKVAAATSTEPELDMSNAKLNKTTFAPGESITISGIKVKNADYVHFSGNNAYISTKDIDVTNSSSYVSVGNVTLTIPSSSATGSFYISVTAYDDEGNASAINKTLTYKVAAASSTEPELDMSNAKLNKSTYAPGETITISGIKAKYADYVHFSGSNAYISAKDVDVTNSSSYVSVGNVTLTIPSSSATGSFYISVTACDDEGNASAINKTLTYTVAAAASAVPVLDTSNAKLNKTTFAPGETITISGIKAKNADYVFIGGDNGYLNNYTGGKEVSTTYSSSYVTVSSTSMSLPSDTPAGSYKLSVMAGDDEGNVSSTQWPTALKYTVEKAQTSSKMSYALYKTSGGYISCGFDGYTTTSGRHEGIDFVLGYGKSVYSLTSGEITYVNQGAEGSSGLSTISIYNSATNKTVIYLHSDPIDTLEVGQSISIGQKIATESWRGCSSKANSHTHVEVRNGKRERAAVSVGDSVLDNDNPTPFWNSLGYSVE